MAEGAITGSVQQTKLQHTTNPAPNGSQSANAKLTASQQLNPWLKPLWYPWKQIRQILW